MNTVTLDTWYDTISPESAEFGDFESTGNDLRETVYSLDDVDDAQAAVESAAFILREYPNFECELVNFLSQHGAHAVFYQDDGDTDFYTGHISYDRASLSFSEDVDAARRKAFLNMVLLRVRELRAC